MHIGTFCEDGTFNLPVGHSIHFLAGELTLIHYSTPGYGEVIFTASVLEETSSAKNPFGLSNPCYLHSQMNTLAFHVISIIKTIPIGNKTI